MACKVSCCFLSVVCLLVAVDAFSLANIENVRYKRKPRANLAEIRKMIKKDCEKDTKIKPFPQRSWPPSWPTRGKAFLEKFQRFWTDAIHDHHNDHVIRRCFCHHLANEDPNISTIRVIQQKWSNCAANLKWPFPNLAKKLTSPPTTPLSSQQGLVCLPVNGRYRRKRHGKKHHDVSLSDIQNSMKENCEEDTGIWPFPSRSWPKWAVGDSTFLASFWNLWNDKNMIHDHKNDHFIRRCFCQQLAKADRRLDTLVVLNQQWSQCAAKLGNWPLKQFVSCKQITTRPTTSQPSPTTNPATTPLITTHVPLITSLLTNPVTIITRFTKVKALLVTSRLTTTKAPLVINHLTTTKTPLVTSRLTTTKTPLVTSRLTTTKAPLVTSHLTTTKAPLVINHFTTTKTPLVTSRLTTTKAPLVINHLTTTKTPLVTSRLTTTKAPLVTSHLTTTKAPLVTSRLTTTKAPLVTSRLTTTKAPLVTSHLTTTMAPMMVTTNLPKTSLVPTDATTTSLVVPDTCVYKGKRYKNNEVWDDGCSTKCICIDQLVNDYICQNSCPKWKNIRPGCKLETKPGVCCPQVVCP